MFIPNFDILKFKADIKNSSGRICGIDFGTHKIGIALTDEKQIIVSPFQIYIRKNLEYDIQQFVNLIKKEKIIAFIIGTVLTESGKIRNQRLFHLTTIFFEKLFNNLLTINCNLPHYFQDESFSSHITNEILHSYNFNKNQIARREDKIAAAIILQEALDEINSL